MPLQANDGREEAGMVRSGTIMPLLDWKEREFMCESVVQRKFGRWKEGEILFGEGEDGLARRRSRATPLVKVEGM